MKISFRRYTRDNHVVKHNFCNKPKCSLWQVRTGDWEHNDYNADRQGSWPVARGRPLTDTYIMKKRKKGLHVFFRVWRGH